MKQIAAALHLSARTVESHKYQMMEALGVRTTADLVRYALQIGLVPTSLAGGAPPAPRCWGAPHPKAPPPGRFPDPRGSVHSTAPPRPPPDLGEPPTPRRRNRVGSLSLVEACTARRALAQDETVMVMLAAGQTLTPDGATTGPTSGTREGTTAQAQQMSPGHPPPV